MKEAETIQELSVLGGPLHRLGRRLGLVRGGTNTIRLGVALGLLAWGVLMLLAAPGRIRPQGIFSGGDRRPCSLPGGNSAVFPVRNVGRSPDRGICPLHRANGLVAEASLPALAVGHPPCQPDEGFLAGRGPCTPGGDWVTPDQDDHWICRRRTGSWASILHSTGGLYLDEWLVSGVLPAALSISGLALALEAGSLVVLPLARTKLELRLVPTHSDGVAGLGYLEIVHENFAPLVLAISAVYSGQFAEAISSGTMAFETLYSLGSDGHACELRCCSSARFFYFRLSFGFAVRPG